MPMEISASLSVDDRNVSARSTDAKPDATDGMDQRIGLVTVDLAADASDINVDNVGRGIKMQIPDMLQQHRSGNNLAFVANQILKNLELAWQQFYFQVTAAHCPGHQVHLEITNAQHGFLDDGRASSGESFDARQQFREGKWFDQVIVATGAQSTHPIIDLTKRADNQRGRDDPGFPQASDDRKSIDARKHAVDGHHGIRGRTPAAQSVIAVVREINPIAVRRQEIRKLRGCLRVVFNDENAALSLRHDLASLLIKIEYHVVLLRAILSQIRNL